MSKFNNFKSTVVALTTSAAEVLPQNKNRSALLLFNQSAETVRWYFDANSTVYFELEGGKGMYFPDAPINQINALTTSGTANLSVMEA